MTHKNVDILNNTVKDLQYNLNRLFNTNLVENGLNEEYTNSAIIKYGNILGSTDVQALLQLTNQVLSFPLTKQGDNNASVGYIQYRVGADINRVYDANTSFYVKMWQSNHNLVSNGIIDIKSWQKLFL